MGMFDEVRGAFPCPSCGHATETAISLKGWASSLRKYALGDRVEGGPYLDGAYGRHSMPCASCGSEFLPLVELVHNKVSGFRSMTLVDAAAVRCPPKDLFVAPPITEEGLFELILANCVTLALRGCDISGLRAEVDWSLRIVGGQAGDDIVRIYHYLRMLTGMGPSLESVVGRLRGALAPSHVHLALDRYDGYDGIDEETLGFALERHLPPVVAYLPELAAHCPKPG